MNHLHSKFETKELRARLALAFHGLSKGRAFRTALGFVTTMLLASDMPGAAARDAELAATAQPEATTVAVASLSNPLPSEGAPWQLQESDDSWNGIHQK